MEPQLVDALLGRLDLLAEKLGTTSAKVWSFSVAAKLVRARAGMVISCFISVVGFLFLSWTYHVAASIPAMPTGDASSVYGGSAIASALLGLGCCIMGIVEIIDCAYSMKTAEYDAFIDIIETLKPNQDSD